MASFVIFIIFVVIITMTISGALGVYVMGEKGQSMVVGFIVSAIAIIIGPILLFLFVNTNDQVVVNEMFDRNLITLEKKKQLTQIIDIKKEEALKEKK